MGHLEGAIVCLGFLVQRERKPFTSQEQGKANIDLVLRGESLLGFTYPHTSLV